MTGPRDAELSAAPETTETELGAFFEVIFLSERPRTMPENHDVVEVEDGEDGDAMFMSAVLCIWIL